MKFLPSAKTAPLERPDFLPVQLIFLRAANAKQCFEKQALQNIVHLADLNC